MYTLGIDIGSTASKAVALKDGKELIGHTVESLGTGTEGSKLALKNLLTRQGSAERTSPAPSPPATAA